jgi:hypothetical protein
VEMLLMGLCISVFGMAVAALAFGAATRPEIPPAVVAAAADRPAVQPVKSRFFGEGAVAPASIPIEALLLQIQNHVRLEQAAAESFVEFPTPALLHSKTISTFVN